MLPKPIANAIAVIVTAVWAANNLAQLVPGVSYHPDVSINAVFMSIVGGMFALGRKASNGKTNTSNGNGSNG